MSAGAVRQGRVFVEIGADTRSFFSAISSVNREIGGLSRAMSQVGMTVAAAGSAVFAPIAAAGAALAASSTEAVRAENAMRAVAEAIALADAHHIGDRDAGALACVDAEEAHELGLVLDVI